MPWCPRGGCSAPAPADAVNTKGLFVPLSLKGRSNTAFWKAMLFREAKPLTPPTQGGLTPMAPSCSCAGSWLVPGSWAGPHKYDRTNQVRPCCLELLLHRHGRSLCASSSPPTLPTPELGGSAQPIQLTEPALFIYLLSSSICMCYKETAWSSSAPGPLCCAHLCPADNLR